jgi:hypothetical protein
LQDKVSFVIATAAAESDAMCMAARGNVTRAVYSCIDLIVVGTSVPSIKIASAGLKSVFLQDKVSFVIATAAAESDAMCMAAGGNLTRAAAHIVVGTSVPSSKISNAGLESVPVPEKCSFVNATAAGRDAMCMAQSPWVAPPRQQTNLRQNFVPRADPLHG